MGFFDKLFGVNKVKAPSAPTRTSEKTPISKQQSNSIKDYNLYTVHFTGGHLTKITPYPSGGYYENRDIANNAIHIISDGVSYNLADIQSIRSIEAPKYTLEKRGGIGTTGYLEYVLRMRSGNYWNEAKYDLSIACLEKATHLMKYSTMDWSPKDFFRIVNELNDLGRFKKAKEWKKWIERNVPGARSAASPSVEEQMTGATKDSFNTRIKSCKELGTDLVEIGDCGACCSICAMYRKRVYSLHGEDKRFPKFPKDYHWGCGISGWPYIYGVSEPSFPCREIISYSNRPFIDDRTDEEIKNYENRLKMLNSQPEIVRTPNVTRIIYYRLVQLLPGDAPKSLSGFSRMRNVNSKNYQALVKKAEAVGFIFPETLEDVASWPENR